MFLLQHFVCAGASSSSRLSNTCTNRSGGKTQSTAHLCLRRSISGTVRTAQTARMIAPIGMSSLSSFCVPGVAWPFSPRSPIAVCLCDSATPFSSFCEYPSCRHVQHDFSIFFYKPQCVECEVFQDIHHIHRWSCRGQQCSRDIESASPSSQLQYCVGVFTRWA